MRARSTGRPHGRAADGARVAVAAVLMAVAALAGPGVAAAQDAGGGMPRDAVLERALESRTKGADTASVVIFEVADFQCPYCARFATGVAQELHERYVETERVQWVFVNLPLHTHPLAWLAAEAALCAGAAGDRFWAMHDRLFETQDEWGGPEDPAEAFEGFARELGVPIEGYRACTERDQVAPIILQDVGSVVSAGITGTPTFVIMRDGEVVERVVGMRSVEEWAELLESIL